MLEDNPQSKGEKLLKQFSNYGYKPTNKISKSELILFFEHKLRNAQFNEDLKNVFAYLNINDTTTITIEQFISGVLQFEGEIRNNYEMIKSQYLQQENIYNNILQQCQKYGAEKYNEEGFGESANLHGEIVNIQFKKYIQGCQAIILTIEYDGQKKELKPKYVPNGNIIINEPIEFKAKSKKGTIEIHVQGDTGYGYIFELGSASYTLPEIKTQEDFTDKIIIPEIAVYGQDPKTVKTLAEMNVKLGMIWSYYEIFEAQRQNEEPKLNQLRMNLQNIEESLQKFNQIYGENIITSTMLMERRNEFTSAKKLNESDNNVFEDKSNKRKKFEFPGKNFEVEFNYMRMDKQKVGVKVDFKDDIQLSNIKKLTTNSKNFDLENSQIRNNLQLLNENNMNIPQSPNMGPNLNMNIPQSPNLEQNGMNLRQSGNMEPNLNMNLEQNQSMEQNPNLEQNLNMQQNNMNLEQNPNMEHSRNIENSQNMQHSRNLEQNPNMEQNPNLERSQNLEQNNMNNFEPNQNLEKSQSINPEENENLKKSENRIFDETPLEKSEVLEQPLQKEENMQPNFGQDIKDTGGVPQDDNEDENNENVNNPMQNLNISHHSNVSKGSNLMQSPNMLQQSKVSYNYNLTRKSNEIRNSRNMLQNSKLQQSNMAQNPNLMNNSNMLQRSMQQNSQIMQNPNLQQSNMLQQPNLMNNSNMLQRSIHQNSQVMQNPNLQQSNRLQQSNVMNNSNILQRSMQQNSQVMQNPNLQQSNRLQQSNAMNNSNMLQRSIHQNSQMMQNPNLQQSNIQQSNMLQQPNLMNVSQRSNAMNNSNILQRSNISQRSNAMQNPNIQQSNMAQNPNLMQNQNLQQSNSMNNSNMLLRSNISKRSNVMNNSNMQQNSMLQKSKTMQNPSMVQRSNMPQNPNISHHSNLMQNSNMIRNSQRSNASKKDLEKIDFNQAQSFVTINQPIINKSTSKEIIQENTLPSQYLPEKLNQEIVENTGTLPLIETEQNIAYSTSQNYNNTASYQSQFYENQNL